MWAMRSLHLLICSIIRSWLGLSLPLTSPPAGVRFDLEGLVETSASTWLAVGIGYLLGSMPTGYLVARHWRGIDIREHGDRHTGAKNVWRVAGLRGAAITVAADIAKGMAAMFLARVWPVPEWGVVLVALAVVAGHNWSAFLGFRGGAGLAPAIGVLFATLSRETLLVAVLYIVIAATLGRRIGLGLSSALVLPALVGLAWWLGEPVHLILVPLVLWPLMGANLFAPRVVEALRRASTQKSRR